jgi:hypothetical protein
LAKAGRNIPRPCQEVEIAAFLVHFLAANGKIGLPVVPKGLNDLSWRRPQFD